MNNILPNSIELLAMSDDELCEHLLSDIYNKAALRETVKRLVGLARQCTDSADYERVQRGQLQSALDSISAICKRGA